ncbi:MAG: class I SAM-dependent methyltransferase [bacterium]
MTDDSSFPAMTWEEAVRWLREQPDQQELVWACFFDDPLAAAAERFYQGPEWRAVRRLLPPRPTEALDLGAGRGISSYALAREGWDVVALEPDSSALVGAGAIRSLSAETGLAIRVVQEWGEQLPFDDGSFELVYGRQVLHHARDLRHLCAEASRVLRPGGLLIATREHVISRPEDLPAFLRSHPLHHLYGGEHAYLLAEYRRALESSGLKILQTLNPYESDINLFPTRKADLRSQLAKRFHWPFAAWIPDGVLRWFGRRVRAPGCLYSFVARKTT